MKNSKYFLIGTLRNPKDHSSHAYRGKWCVNCLNMWIATLGKTLNLENAIFYHLIIVLHELTHVFSGEEDHESDPYSWDRFIEKILKELT